MMFCSLALSAQTISVAQLNLWDDEPAKSLAQLWGEAAQNPKSAEARVNVSYALLSQNRLQQAEWTARESLKLDPENSQAQPAHIRLHAWQRPTCSRTKARLPAHVPSSRHISPPAPRTTCGRLRTG
jgi:hypothetical protein